jgi:hypothetical protein
MSRGATAAESGAIQPDVKGARLPIIESERENELPIGQLISIRAKRTNEPASAPLPLALARLPAAARRETSN